MQSMYFDNFLTEKECEHWINFIKNLNQDELNSDIKHNVMDSELSNSFAKRYIKDAKGSGRVTFVQYGENSKGLGRHKDFIGEKNVINTNHVIINAILNTKYQEAISKNIVFVFKVNDLSKIVIDDEDMVVILANLLNNAIEACEKCEEKKTIKLKFVIEENLIVLSVKNTCSNLIIYSGNEIKTSKKDEPEMHGIGIKNIIQIVEKYNGEYVIKNENNEFSFSIIIPL